MITVDTLETSYNGNVMGFSVAYWLCRFSIALFQNPESWLTVSVALPSPRFSREIGILLSCCRGYIFLISSPVSTILVLSGEFICQMERRIWLFLGYF